jgi:hypothetical protein
MKRALLVAAVLLLIAACGDDSGSDGTAIPAGAHEVEGACGATVLYTGASEDWTASAGGPTDLVQATSHDGNAVAFLFGNPLRAGEPENPANKILWVVKQPRGMSDLEIAGHPLDAEAPTVAQSEAADSSPGEIYPSIVNVPSPGCWHFTLQWNGNTDTIDLPYTRGS